jgi:hypothetical protein
MLGVFCNNIRNQKQLTFVCHEQNDFAMGKFLIFTGLLLIAVGLLIQYFPRLPFLGNLPGDFRFESKNVKLYFPLASSLLISLLVSLIIFLINKARQ